MESWSPPASTMSITSSSRMHVSDSVVRVRRVASTFAMADVTLMYRPPSFLASATNQVMVTGLCVESAWRSLESSIVFMSSSRTMRRSVSRPVSAITSS